MNETVSRKCAPRQRCRQHRICDACAAIRQAQIADQAEALLRGHLQLQLIVIKPTDKLACTLKRAIQQTIRNNNLRAGIWTIERGQEAGTLHANILTYSQDVKKAKNTVIHTDNVRTNARVVAAYISKKSQAPREDEWHGRTFASFGHISKTLLSADMPAIIHGAAVENALRKASNEPLPAVPALRTSAPHDLTKQEYAEIASRHLPRLAAYAKASETDQEIENVQFKRR